MWASSTRPTVSPRPRAHTYEEYVTQQQQILAGCRTNINKDLADGSKLCCQMTLGFTSAGLVGLILLVLGTVFITEALGTQEPMIVMLCVMGIVFGIIILVGTLILGKLLISRKWIRCQGNRATLPAGQCIHTCSVIYNPSLDQLGDSDSAMEPPPPYDSVISLAPHPTAGHLGDPDQATVMILPPKYDEVTKPLPVYLKESPVTKY